jgi:hypothetical protein
MKKPQNIKSLENTEGTIKNGKCRETCNTGHTRQRNKNKQTTQYVLDTTMHHQTNNNVNIVRTYSPVDKLH